MEFTQAPIDGGAHLVLHLLHIGKAYGDRGTLGAVVALVGQNRRVRAFRPINVRWVPSARVPGFGALGTIWLPKGIALNWLS
jgi:hypothetical protein